LFDSALTREALLDAAEELFATFGVEGTSIRSINAAAGFAPTAVHRHFGSKDRLLEAVVRRRGDATAARQRELLDALPVDERTPMALDLVEVWALPYRELIEHDTVGGFRWLQLLARLVLAQDPRMAKLSSEFGLVQRLPRTVRYGTGLGCGVGHAGGQLGASGQGQAKGGDRAGGDRRDHGHRARAKRDDKRR
jgi:AcrR family transcriptional regulator